MGREQTPLWVLQRLERSPVRAAWKEYFGTSIAFSRKCNIQWSVLYNTELCCFSEIPPSIWYTLKSKGIDMDKLDDDYRNTQKENRRDFGEVFLVPLFQDGNFVFDPRSCPTESVKRALSMSRGELSKGLCIQPATLYRLAEGIFKTLPDEMVKALNEAGVDRVTIGVWNECTREYYQAVA